MPVRIRLSRKGTKKRPFYRIVVADSRRSRDGKFIDQLGTYNPILSKDNPERLKLNTDKAQEWIKKGAQPSDRVRAFLSNLGIVEKVIITEKTKQHLPRKKTQEKLDAAKKAEAAPATKEAEAAPATPPAKEPSAEKEAEAAPATKEADKNKEIIQKSNDKIEASKKKKSEKKKESKSSS